MTDSRVRIIWEQGLCRCGCGGRLNRPEARFLRGHDFKLMDDLVDAHRAAESSVLVISPFELDLPPRVTRPRAWAKESFFPKGYRWFLLLTGIVDDADPDEAPLLMAVNPVPHLDLGSVDASRKELTKVAEHKSGDDEGLLRDLETVREIVARAAESGAEDSETVKTLLDQLKVAMNRIAELESSQVVVSFDDAQVASLTDYQVLAAANARVRAAAVALGSGGYDGDSSEMWDIISLLPLGERDPVRIRAARALLGQET